MIRFALALSAALVAFPAFSQGFVEPPALAKLVSEGKLPPIEQRVPRTPLTTDPAASGREVGAYGGQIVTLVPRARDIRYLSTYA